jgi:hypothetical protein
MSLADEISDANTFAADHDAAHREEAEALLEEIERSRMAVRELVRVELARLAALSPRLIDRTDWKGRTGIALELGEAIEGQAQIVDESFIEAFDRAEFERLQREAGQ